MWGLGEEGFESKMFSLLLVMAEFDWAASLGDKEVPVWFLLGASSLLFLVLYKLYYLWKQQLEYDVLKMALQQDVSISLWAGGGQGE